MKLVKLSEETNSGKMRTPIDALEDCLKDLKTDDDYKDVNKILIIPLTQNSNEYHVTWNQAGMSLAEMVGLLECAKMKVFEEIWDAKIEGGY